METAKVPCMLQCDGEPCNPAMDTIGSIERWEKSYGLIQLQWHTQKDTEKQAHSEVLSPACRSTRTIHFSHWHGHDLEDGNADS